MRSRWVWVSLFVVCVANSAFAQPDLSRVRVVTLENGLRVLLAPDSTARTVDVAVWYRAGTRYEKPGLSGLAHLFGHLMLGGSKNFAPGDHRRLLEGAGATLNSLINPDYCCFYETLPRGSVELPLRLEADRMSELVIGAAGLAAGRRAVAVDRRARLRPSPIALGIELLYATAFADHPYARPMLGRGTDLDRVTLDDVQAYYRERFAPNQALLTLVGGFDPEASLAAVRREFGARPRRPAPPPPPLRPPGQMGERRKSSVAAIPARVLLVGWQGPASRDPDAPAMEVLAQIVTAGETSRLKRLAAGRPADYLQTDGGFDRDREASLLFSAVAVPAGADSAAAERALEDAVEGMAQQVTDEELDRAKRQIEARTLFGWQAARGRAEMLGLGEILDGDYRAVRGRWDKYLGLDAEAVRRVAAKFLKMENRAVVWLTPSTAAASSSPTGDAEGRR